MARALMGELAMFAVTLDMEDIPTFVVGSVEDWEGHRGM